MYTQDAKKSVDELTGQATDLGTKALDALTAARTAEQAAIVAKKEGKWASRLANIDMDNGITKVSASHALAQICV